jgi:hypothetical protein
MLIGLRLRRPNAKRLEAVVEGVSDLTAALGVFASLLTGRGLLLLTLALKLSLLASQALSQKLVGARCNVIDLALQAFECSHRRVAFFVRPQGAMSRYPHAGARALGGSLRPPRPAWCDLPEPSQAYRRKRHACARHPERERR